MLNEKIIKEFERLIAFIKSKKETEKNIKNITANTFRLRQLNTVITVLKRYPEKITLKNYKELQKLDGIGSHTIERIEEILEKGSLSELVDFVDTSVNKEKIITELEEVVGIGRANAVDFYNQGITSIKMLKDKVKKKEIQVSEKIELGLRYYGVYKTNIPRSEIDDVLTIIKKIISKMNTHYQLENEQKYIFEICGSYRREKPTSGDIDILISKLDVITSDDADEINHLHRVIKRLKENIKQNDDKPLLVDDITDKNYETKYMGFLKLKDNPVRRIDIRFVPFESYYSALLYFTGSAELNKKMRVIAKQKGYKLSEYGLKKIDSKDDDKIKITSEDDIFKKLNMDYIEPKFR